MNDAIGQVTGSQDNAPETQKTPISRRRLIVRIAGGLMAAIILLLGTTAVGVYRFGWDNGFTRSVERIVPLPVAVVNWHPVTLADYRQRLEAFQKAMTYNQEFDFNDPANAEVVKQQSDALIQRLIDMKIEEQAAREFGVSVSAEDIEKEFTNIALQTQVATSSLDTLLMDVYGWSRSQFIEEIVKPQVLERKLQGHLAKDEQINNEAYTAAREVRSKILSGEEFSDLAEQYSDDPGSSETGGDLGWNPKGSFVPEFEDAAEKLQPGDTSEIIATQFGLHIIQVLGRAVGEDGVERTHTRHILFATKDFSVWLNERAQTSKIWRFAVR